MAAVHTSPPSNPGSTGDFSHAAHEPLHLPDHALNDSHISHPLEEREFAYNWEEKKGVAVASLKILAPAAFSKNIPTFLGSGPVKGTAVLNLDKPDTIKSVVVSVSRTIDRVTTCHRRPGVDADLNAFRSGVDSRLVFWVASYPEQPMGRWR